MVTNSYDTSHFTLRQTSHYTMWYIKASSPPVPHTNCEGEVPIWDPVIRLHREGEVPIWDPVIRLHREGEVPIWDPVIRLHHQYVNTDTNMRPVLNYTYR